MMICTKSAKNQRFMRNWPFSLTRYILR